MNAIALSCITFACISGGALLGMFLPGHHLSTEEKDVVKLGTGLIGTIAVARRPHAAQSLIDDAIARSYLAN